MKLCLILFLVLSSFLNAEYVSYKEIIEKEFLYYDNKNNELLNQNLSYLKNFCNPNKIKFYDSCQKYIRKNAYELNEINSKLRQNMFFKPFYGMRDFDTNNICLEYCLNKNKIIVSQLNDLIYEKQIIRKKVLNQINSEKKVSFNQKYIIENQLLKKAPKFDKNKVTIHKKEDNKLLFNLEYIISKNKNPFLLIKKSNKMRKIKDNSYFGFSFIKREQISKDFLILENDNIEKLITDTFDKYKLIPLDYSVPTIPGELKIIRKHFKSIFSKKSDYPKVFTNQSIIQYIDKNTEINLLDILNNEYLKWWIFKDYDSNKYLEIYYTYSGELIVLFYSRDDIIEFEAELDKNTKKIQNFL